MRETLEQSTTARVGVCGVICIASVDRLRLASFLKESVERFFLKCSRSSGND